MNNFGQLMRKHRIETGMTQQAFAKELGISAHQLWNIEFGKTIAPSAMIVARMVVMLHLSPKQAFMLLKALAKDNNLTKNNLQKDEE